VQEEKGLKSDNFISQSLDWQQSQTRTVWETICSGSQFTVRVGRKK
jgi:hypothetical protein